MDARTYCVRCELACWSMPLLASISLRCHIIRPSLLSIAPMLSCISFALYLLIKPVGPVLQAKGNRWEAVFPTAYLEGYVGHLGQAWVVCPPQASHQKLAMVGILYIKVHTMLQALVWSLLRGDTRSRRREIDVRMCTPASAINVTPRRDSTAH